MKNWLTAGIASVLGLGLIALAGIPATAAPVAAPLAALTGHVTWQGRPAQPNALQQLPLTLVLQQGTTQAAFSNITTDANGNFSTTLTNLPNGAYTWWLKGPQFLANSGTLTLTGGNITEEMGLQRTGDTNNDNVVDLTDFTLVRNSYGRACGDSGYDARAELTGDCLVDIGDFTLVRTNYGQAGATAPVIWTPTNTPTATPTNTPTRTATSVPTATPPGTGSIYWGAYIRGDTYGYGDAPYDPRSIDAFESHAQKRVSIVAWGQAWKDSNNVFQPFHAPDFETVRLRGGIPLVDWEPWRSCCGATQPEWRLSAITSGTYDSYIRQWATDARAYGHPFFVRLGEEMNGTWYPWSEGANGNQVGEFVPMWRHVHDIFTQVGATNVTWVWNPNREWDSSQPLEGLYPGDSYVDWVALDGYNWGNSNGDVWTDFAGVFGPSYNHLSQLAPSKPIMIAETSSTEHDGSKAAWITDALAVQVPLHYPRIKALVWFNWDADGMDWVIESSPSAQSAFAGGIASPYYAANTFANLPAGPIQPPH